jgi:hypothetical protein
MGKSLYKKSKQARLKAAKQWQEIKNRKRAFPYVVTIKQCCGCCESTLRFKTEAAFLEQWSKLELTVSGAITDDEGITHKSLDTFYGYCLGSKNDRSIDFLISQIMNKPIKANQSQ